MQIRTVGQTFLSVRGTGRNACLTDFYLHPRPLEESYWGPKRWWYSPDTINALTISALRKSPLNWSSLPSQ